MSKLYDFFRNNISKKIMHDLKYKSIMQVPKIKKITLNIGLGSNAVDKKILENAIADLKSIAGQKPTIIKARKSIAGFKIRRGINIGCKVTLRKTRMWDFFERLVYIAIPRIRDFRGFSTNSFDKHGNYTIGIREQIIFPEIEYDKIDRLRGFNITITTSAKNSHLGYILLSYLKFPFKNK